VRLVDANVLIYAVNAASAHHEPSRAWLDEAVGGREPVGFAWTVLLAFLRLSTHPSVFARPLTPDEATGIVRAWLAQPAAVIVEPTARHADVLAGLLAEAGTAGNLVNDAHLAALAIEHAATVTTFDADFGRFPGVRWERPGA
jgi:toxin-antitoxin system PIN domain toxin